MTSRAALLFDLDGTLVDSDAKHLAAFQRVFASRSAVLDDKEAAYRSELVDIAPIAGAVALLDFADRRGLKRAVVTNGPRANAEKALSALGLELRLPIVVIGSELPRSKPDPLPYLKGLELTGALASRSIAFEDSPSGVRAAMAAGLAVVGLTTTLDAATLIGAGATIAANDFTDPRIFALIEKRIQASCSVGAH